MNLRKMALGPLLALLVALPVLAADAPRTSIRSSRRRPAWPTWSAGWRSRRRSTSSPAPRPRVERLGVPEYDYWNESLHGVARAGRATVFPQAIGLAATFDPDLMGRVATAISDEARAKHNASVRAGFRQRYRGPDLLDPEHQHLPRPALGPGSGDLRRGPLPHGPDGERLRAGAAGGSTRAT